jgi:uncharacterized small protein (DUF1192 family)
MIEDDPVRAVSRTIVGEKLDAMSIDDLQDRVDELRAEIQRTEAVLSSKRAGRAAADAVFGKS